MDFSYSKTEQLFLQMIRSFAENEVKPLAAEVDDQERFPVETVEKMGKLGIMGIPIPNSLLVSRVVPPSKLKLSTSIRVYGDGFSDWCPVSRGSR